MSTISQAANVSDGYTNVINHGAADNGSAKNVKEDAKARNDELFEIISQAGFPERGVSNLPSPTPPHNQPKSEPDIKFNLVNGPKPQDEVGSGEHPFDGLLTPDGGDSPLRDPNYKQPGSAGSDHDVKLPTNENPNGFDPLFTYNKKPVVEFQKRPYIIQPVYDVSYNRPIVLKSEGSSDIKPINIKAENVEGNNKLYTVEQQHLIKFFSQHNKYGGSVS